MKALKFSAPKLSDRSGVPLPSIKSILNGKSQDPRISTLTALADALNCSVTDLIGGKTSEEAQPFADHEYRDRIFRAVIEMVDQVAVDKGIRLQDNHAMRKSCIERLFTYSYHTLKDKDEIMIDRVYAEWVFDTMDA